MTTSEALRAAWTDERREQQSTRRLGERNENWQGDQVGYTGAHFRARAAILGKPCAHLDETCRGPVEAALDHEAPADRLLTVLAGKPYEGLSYSPRPEDYLPLCRSHHMRYDGHRRAR